MAMIFSLTPANFAAEKLPTPEFAVKVIDNQPVIKLTKYPKAATYFALYCIDPKTKKYGLMGYVLGPGKSYTDTHWDFQKKRYRQV